MNLHALRVFAAVAAQKSVTTAAATLRLSQPAVTIQIRRLENETGLKLIVPDGRGIKLTEDGIFLAEQASRLFALESSTEDRLAEFKGQKKNHIRIASTYLPANFLLPKSLAAFKQLHPVSDITLYSGNSSETIRNLLHYRADIAFIVKEAWHQPEIEFVHLVDLEYVFVVPRGHIYAGKKIPFSSLVKEPFLFREEGSSTREILSSLCQINGVPLPPIGLLLYGLNESIQSVLAGYGTMLAPLLAVQDYLQRDELCRVQIQGPIIRRPVYLCCRKADLPTAGAKEFIDIVRQKLHPLGSSYLRNFL